MVMDSLQQRISRLVTEQLASWKTAQVNYAALQNIQYKTLYFDGFQIKIQFNPARIRSTTAPLDPGTRPCFLCAANRPPEQQAVRWRNYEILVNPYPIFDPHLTVAADDHFSQFLTGKLQDMVDLAAELPDFVILFNGARAGASAPDHFHFQTVAKGVLPAETELPKWANRQTLYNNGPSVWAADDYLRPAIVVEGTRADETAQAAERVLDCLKETMHTADEAQVNVLTWSELEKFTVVIFPRTAHRPREYDAPQGERFLFSPGVVEMAGSVVTVRPEDFERADVPLLTKLFLQVVPDATIWESIKYKIHQCLTANLK